MSRLIFSCGSHPGVASIWPQPFDHVVHGVAYCHDHLLAEDGTKLKMLDLHKYKPKVKKINSLGALCARAR